MKKTTTKKTTKKLVLVRTTIRQIGARELKVIEGGLAVGPSPYTTQTARE